MVFESKAKLRFQTIRDWQNRSLHLRCQPETISNLPPSLYVEPCRGIFFQMRIIDPWDDAAGA